MTITHLMTKGSNQQFVWNMFGSKNKRDRKSFIKNNLQSLQVALARTDNKKMEVPC